MKIAFLFVLGFWGIRTVQGASKPTARPTAKPSPQPTTLPTAFPSTPTAAPTRLPTNVPSPIPSRLPTQVPTQSPTKLPSPLPTALPTEGPSPKPSSLPTAKPTAKPSAEPTVKPTLLPTPLPTYGPTVIPTVLPSKSPTSIPSARPTLGPTSLPTTNPTPYPTSVPTRLPTPGPSSLPTIEPSFPPTVPPTQKPTAIPTPPPTQAQTMFEVIMRFGGISAATYNSQKDENDAVLISTILAVCNDAPAIAAGRVLKSKNVLNLKLVDDSKTTRTTRSAIVSSRQLADARLQSTLTYQIATSLPGATYIVLSQSIISSGGPSGLFGKMLIQFALTKGMSDLFNVTVLATQVSNLNVNDAANNSNSTSGMNITTLVIISVSVVAFFICSYCGFHLRKKYCRRREEHLQQHYYYDQDRRSHDRSTEREEFYFGTGNASNNHHHHHNHHTHAPSLPRQSHHTNRRPTFDPIPLPERTKHRLKETTNRDSNSEPPMPPQTTPPGRFIHEL